MTAPPTVVIPTGKQAPTPSSTPEPPATSNDPQGEKPSESLDLAFRNLRSSARGLNGREAARRLIVDGPNTLSRRGKPQWPRELLAQFTQPLALLLVAAAILAAVSGSVPLAIAIVAVIALNAIFAFFQERHAEHAVEALAAYLPAQARVLRDGSTQDVPADNLVPGDVMLIDEGDRISADARLISGSIEVDLSTLTGESQPATRAPGRSDAGVALLQAANMVFSGSACVAGQARAVVTATGMHSEIGRIAALSERAGSGDGSPLEAQVKKVAKLIALVSIVVALAFLPLGALAGLSIAAAVSFAIGMLVANVPEGLLPTITLALAAGVQNLAHKGAVVKRLSAVETLGSTTVICTDKTGTLTQNRMQVTDLWTDQGSATCTGTGQFQWADDTAQRAEPLARLVATTASRCCTATLSSSGVRGDPTEIALLQLAAAIVPASVAPTRKALFRFDPRLRLMTTIDVGEDVPPKADGAAAWINTKGAPEAVLARCVTIATSATGARPLTDADAAVLAAAIDAFGRRGLRLLAIARRPSKPSCRSLPTDRWQRPGSACWAWSPCSTRPGRRRTTPSPEPTGPASACSSSPATTASPRLR